MVVAQNEVTGSRIGIHARSGTLADSLISENTSNENRGAGILLQESAANEIIKQHGDRESRDRNLRQQRNWERASRQHIIGNRASGIVVGAFPNFTGNQVSDNPANDNGFDGIRADLGATGNRFEHNSMQAMEAEIRRGSSTRTSATRC